MEISLLASVDMILPNKQNQRPWSECVDAHAGLRPSRRRIFSSQGPYFKQNHSNFCKHVYAKWNIPPLAIWLIHFKFNGSNLIPILKYIL